MKSTRKQGKVTRVAAWQTGKTHVKPDKKILAIRPGMRVSAKPNPWGAGGKPYWEDRRNRSDKNRRRKL